MKKCGILLPVFSLPGEYSTGTMGKEAEKFVDFLASAGQDFWQVLPLQPADHGGSPYSSESAFACDTDYIDLDGLVDDGLLKAEEVAPLKGDFPRALHKSALRTDVLKIAYSRFEKNADYEQFIEKESYWLNDYAMYSVLKGLHGGKCWSDWKDKYRLRDRSALEELKRTHDTELDLVRFGQYVFSRQWKSLRDRAAKCGIEIIGDIPIYVSYDSVDVWSHPHLFMLDKQMKPALKAGCPPDEFNEDGQLWGNPVYDWDAMKRSGYDWWIDRFKRVASLYDIVRLDHFRGFESFYAVPAGNENARVGEWLEGRGAELFDRVKERLPKLEFIAEDLGFITEKVRELVKHTGFPNMKVCQFALEDGKKSEHFPKNYPKTCVAYTGTHDNDTVEGWYSSLSRFDKKKARRLFRARPFEKISAAMIRAVMKSEAKYAVFPLADVLSLNGEARINTPGTVGKNNWSYRLDTVPGSEAATYLRHLKAKYRAGNVINRR